MRIRYPFKVESHYRRASSEHIPPMSGSLHRLIIMLVNTLRQQTKKKIRGSFPNPTMAWYLLEGLKEKAVLYQTSRSAANYELSLKKTRLPPFSSLGS